MTHDRDPETLSKTHHLSNSSCELEQEVETGVPSSSSGADNGKTSLSNVGRRVRGPELDEQSKEMGEQTNEAPNQVLTASQMIHIVPSNVMGSAHGFIHQFG